MMTNKSKMIVDAHQHVWDLNKVAYPWLNPEFGPLYRTYEARELLPQLQDAGVNKTILVQAANSYEDTNYMLETAAASPWVTGVVGWVPLNRPEEAVRMLEHYTRNPLFKGVRHLIHDEPDPDWILQDVVIEGLKVLVDFGISFDFVAVFPNHLKHVPTLVERVPGLRIVIDHLAKPPIKERRMESWGSQLAAAASYPQVYAKLSGLNTAADWETWCAQDLQPYIDKALELFGANRLMFGSDWPVARLAGEYAQVWKVTLATLHGCTQEEIDNVLGGTASEFYRLEVGQG